MAKTIKTLFIGLPSIEKYSNISPPIGLCYLSSMLKHNGYSAKIIDASSFSMRKIKKVLEEENPDLLGIQCLTIERGQAYKVAKIAKKVLPKVKIVFGGQHASNFPDQMFKLAHVDFVVMGEGEYTTLELVKALSTNKKYEKINGLAYKISKKKAIINPPRELIQDLDVLPFPDYSTIDPKNYVMGNFEDFSVPILTSRGCPYNCAFCSSTQFWHRKYRARSAENVLKEIDYLVKERGLKNISFYDDNFIIDKRRLIEICKGLVERKYDLKFGIASSVKILDDERLEWLKKAGCIEVGFGVESGSPIILKNISKFQTPEDIKRAFKLVRKHGMIPGGSLIVGCPGETKETIKETAEMMNEICPEHLSYGGILWILPGTPIYTLSKQKKIIDDSVWMKTDRDIYYTAEYSYRQLKSFQKQLLYYQARKRDFSQKFKFLVWFIYLSLPAVMRRVARNFYYTTARTFFRA